MKKFITVPIILLLHFSLSAQIILSGVIRDSVTREVLPYTNVWIANKNIGTISNDFGKYSLKIPANLKYDSLTISYMGYHSKMIGINTLKHGNTIWLAKKNILLKPVIVKAGILKTQGRKKEGIVTFVIRNKDQNKGLSGAEIGMLFKNKNKIKIDKIRFYLAQNGYDTLKIRVHVYNAKNIKVEGRLNIPNNYLTITNKKTGWFTFNVDDNNVIIDGDYLVTLELVKVTPAIGLFALKGMFTPFLKRAYVREHGKWKKSFLSISLYTEITSY